MSEIFFVWDIDIYTRFYIQEVINYKLTIPISFDRRWGKGVDGLGPESCETDVEIEIMTGLISEPAPVIPLHCQIGKSGFQTSILSNGYKASLERR